VAVETRLTRDVAEPALALALYGGSVVTSLDPPELVNADVLIADGRVTAVGAVPEGTRRRDCSGCLIVPGPVCAHAHLYSELARGMPYRLAPPTNFLQILQRVWWRLDRALDEPSIRASALAGGMEALLSGTTTLMDHHASPQAIDGSLDVIADALGELGLRSVLCYEVTDRDGSDRARAGVAENRRFLARLRPLARGMVGVHASFTVSDDTLAACVEVARAAGVGVHIHVAEDAADQGDAVARHKTRVVHRLGNAGALTEDALLAHCTHVDAGEAAAIRAAGATVAHNARSNMNNRVGHAPLALLGGQVALGTDGIDGDMFAESHAAFFRAREGDEAIGPNWSLDRLAVGGRRAGREFGEPGLGRIQPGAPADLTVLRYAPPTPLDSANLAGHWAFGFGASQVRDVYVAGVPVVADGRLTRVDQDELAAKAAVEATRLWRRLDEIEPHTFEPSAVQRESERTNT
jgi:putative selenium metabolism protein SsnA